MTLRHLACQVHLHGPESVPKKLALLQFQTKGESVSFPAGISQSTSALCQQQQFRRLSPHPSASPPEYLFMFSLQESQVLQLRCALFSVREASRVAFILLCEGLLLKKTTGEIISGPAGRTHEKNSKARLSTNPTGCNNWGTVIK